MSRPTRWLFLKERFAWPRASGHDVHTYHMMKALAQRGDSIALATVDEPPPPAIEGIPFSGRYLLSQEIPDFPSERHAITLTGRALKFASYWGISSERILRTAAAAEACSADVVVVSGLNVLPYLGAIQNRACVWYAADEWVKHHLSLVQWLRPKTWKELRAALVKGLYERAYRDRLDRVWVVSKEDARAFSTYAGIDKLDVVPNGVDTDYYMPEKKPTEPNSCVFWGRLDFGPNIQAIAWFCERVWPELRRRVPDAKFNIFGFQPGPELNAYVGKNGVTLTPDLPDIRDAVRASSVVVLPFVSGGGIKNKLLEAAAMGMPIIATRAALTGLQGKPPFPASDSPRYWIEEIVTLWNSSTRRMALKVSTRHWVETNHTWRAAAEIVATGIRDALQSRRAKA